MKEQERRTTVKEGLEVGLGRIGDGCRYLLENRRNGFTLGLYTMLIYGGYFGVKRGLGLAFRQVEKRLNTPALVRDTSRMTLNRLALIPS